MEEERLVVATILTVRFAVPEEMFLDTTSVITSPLESLTLTLTLSALPWVGYVLSEETLRDTNIIVSLTPHISLPSVTELTILVIRKHPTTPVVCVSHLITAVLAMLDPVTNLVQLNAGPVVTSPLTAVRPEESAVPRAGDLMREFVRNTNSRVSLAR